MSHGCYINYIFNVRETLLLKSLSDTSQQFLTFIYPFNHSLFNGIPNLINIFLLQRSTTKWFIRTEAACWCWLTISRTTNGRGEFGRAQVEPPPTAQPRSDWRRTTKSPWSALSTTIRRLSSVSLRMGNISRSNLIIRESLQIMAQCCVMTPGADVAVKVGDSQDKSHSHLWNSCVRRTQYSSVMETYWMEPAERRDRGPVDVSWGQAIS